jgi:hypothetical protein
MQLDMKNILIIVLLFASLLLQLGCGDESDITDSDNGFYWGGHVNLMTESGSPIENKFGVKMYLEGTNFQTYTNQNGDWRIYNVPAGVYNLVASKEGFGYHKFIDFEYGEAGNNDNFWQVLVGTPTYLIDSVMLSQQNNIETITGYPSTTVDYLRFILIYFGKEEPIYDSSHTWEYHIDSQIYKSDNFFTATFTKSGLLDNGFNNGDTVHIAVYPGSRIVERYFLRSENKLINSSGVGPVAKRFIYILQ